MQNDLISRSALKSYIDCGHLRPPTEKCFSELDVVRMLDKQPTIDAEPVRHGRWVWFDNHPVTDADDPECIGCTGYECSECGNNEGTCIRFYEELSPDMLARIKEGLMEFLTNYCPHCGAKMDGDPDV